jgi:hypothetical protein
MRRFVIFIFVQYHTGHQINENSRNGRGNLHVWERSACRGWWGNLEERNHLENLGVDRRIISQEIRWEDMDWIYLA